MKKMTPKSKELGWVCILMVVEAYGNWETEAMETFSLLASHLATISNRVKAVVLADLYGRLNLNLVRANTAAILSRCFVPDYLLFVIIVHVFSSVVILKLFLYCISMPGSKHSWV